ncbi:uncharacterized protein LOC135846068 [Planococcus citri]|uniref:uncharacterized protein LOC135846068 n=1 Tax=Planococcus citri TaxID=170843 RepID=UPI0031F9926B
MADDIKTVLAKLNSIEITVEEITKNVASIKKSIEKLEEQVSNLSKNQDMANLKIENLKKSNKGLRRSVNQLEQHACKNNVIIFGVPETKGENIRKIIFNIAEKLDIQLHDYDIIAANRLLTNSRGTPAILVQLNDRDKRSQFIKQSKARKLNAKNLGFNSNENIYVNEHLTKHTMSLFKKAKALCDEGKILSTWSFEGNIYIRKSEGSESTKIYDADQLDNFIRIVCPSKLKKMGLYCKL